jgi:hypothetical protein
MKITERNILELLVASSVCFIRIRRLRTGEEDQHNQEFIARLHIRYDNLIFSYMSYNVPQNRPLERKGLHR